MVVGFRSCFKKYFIIEAGHFAVFEYKKLGDINLNSFLILAKLIKIGYKNIQKKITNIKKS